MSLDVRTLFVLVIPEAVAFGLLHGACWLRWRDRASLWWMASDWLGASAAILVLFRRLPAWVTFTFAQTAIVVSGLLLWLGFRCMTRRSLPLRGFAVATLAYFGLFYVLRSFVGDIGFLFVLASLALCIVNAGVAADLATVPLMGQRFACRILAVMFLCHALFYLFRSTTSFLAKPAAVFLDMAGLQSVTMLVVLFTVCFWNLGALWLTARQHQEFAMTRVDA